MLGAWLPPWGKGMVPPLGWGWQICALLWSSVLLQADTAAWFVMFFRHISCWCCFRLEAEEQGCRKRCREEGKKLEVKMYMFEPHFNFLQRVKPQVAAIL